MEARYCELWYVQHFEMTNDNTNTTNKTGPQEYVYNNKLQSKAEKEEKEEESEETNTRTSTSKTYW